MKPFARLHGKGRVDYEIPRREIADADRQVAAEIQSIDLLLGDWVDLPKDWARIDPLLDERLYRRPADVMASGEAT